jgi:hypothetical protein
MVAYYIAMDGFVNIVYSDDQTEKKKPKPKLNKIFDMKKQNVKKINKKTKPQKY